MLHKFTLFGSRIVYDVASGSVHVVDELTWRILDYWPVASREEIGAKLGQEYSREEIEEAVRELEELKKEGLLLAEDQAPAALHLRQQSVVKALCLHVAHDCNLRCRYCFAGTGPFGGDRTLMKEETGRQAIDFLLKASGKRQQVEIDFFGGEPLMNFPVVKNLVAYGKEAAAAAGKKIKFTLTTNALLLTEEIERWLNEEEMAVVLSLDGRPEVHDRMRPRLDGSGSYQRTVDHILRFVNSRNQENYYVRGTFTGLQPDFAADVIYMADLGIKHLSVEPVVGAPEEDYALKEEHLPQLLAEYERLTEEFLRRQETGQPFTFFHFNLDLTGGPCLAKRLSGCGAGHEYLACDPEGNLYPCHQFVRNKDFWLGTVDTGVEKPELVQRFQEAHVFNKQKCQNCWARYLCSGGCHASNYHSHGHLLEPYEMGCALEKKRLECAIYIQLKTAGLV
ncbi:thioether cross-link-forming SCIFF peptide maturase [Carboxydocella sp. JDF658]|uniref:thioether cross-link-forming SCIFF peptide maturase n=1 Tax=Carboxydocella sp. JDF658 TaxID=1926600 RepID=UPI0009ADE674|nr:thioether cross-link-forming SCIFF peptide maturase [Carboxydocella sp. JDF658]GAW31613.1 thioether cross-link-forming SCIFF peptide maturase [Carboxydocella sp. JDF658]